MKREEIFKYVKEKYDTEPEYLWKRYPNYAVLRHKDNRKWYAAVMDAEREKLGLEGEGKDEIIDVKCYPEMIGSLRKEKGVLPAYHMNKEYWLTLLLDDSFETEGILELIDLSFELTK